MSVNRPDERTVKHVVASLALVQEKFEVLQHKNETHVSTGICLQIEGGERQNVSSQSRPAINYEDALDMYADDFDEKEKARIEKQAEARKEKGKDATSRTSGQPEIGKATGNGNVEMSSGSGQEESAGNVCSCSMLHFCTGNVCSCSMLHSCTGNVCSCSMLHSCTGNVCSCSMLHSCTGNVCSCMLHSCTGNVCSCNMLHCCTGNVCSCSMLHSCTGNVCSCSMWGDPKKTGLALGSSS